MEETKQAIDLWEKVASLSDEETLDHHVEIHRVLPTEDPLNRVKFPIGGDCGRLQLAQLTREVLYNKVGGGTYKLFVRNSKRGTKLTEGKVEFPGPPVLTFPESLEPAIQKQSQSQSSAPGRSYEDGIAEGERKAERQNEMKEIYSLLNEIRQERRNGNGNGNGHGSRSGFMEAVDAVGKLREVVGLGAGQGNNMDLLSLVKLLREERNAGQTQAQKIAELVAEANAGADPDAIVEKEMVKVLGDLLSTVKTKKQKLQVPAPATGKALTQAQIVHGVFVQVRDRISQVVAEYNVFAGSALKGSSTLEELETNIRRLMDMSYSEEEDEEEDIANAGEKIEPGPDTPNTGDTEAGAKDESP